MKYILAILICFINYTSFALDPDISPDLTAEYNSRKKAVNLKWRNTDDRVITYVLQRSSDNYNWRDIYSLGSGAFSKKKLEKFSDINPESSKNYYRLKIYVASNVYEFTKSIMVIIGKPSSSWIMFPVPVRDVLNLQYNGSEAIQGVVSIFIQNMYGYVLTKRRFSSLNRTIQVPVDNLGRGTYDVRIVINNQTVWNQRFIK